VRPTLLVLALGGHRLALGAYASALALAAVATLAIAYWLARRRGLPAGRTALVLALSALAVPIGARLLHFALNPAVYLADPRALLALDPVGFAAYGGLLLAAAVGVAAARGLGLDLWRTADAAAPALGAGIAIVRIGCFLNGCCFGRVTSGPLGVVFPLGSPAHLRQIGDGVSGLLGPVLPVIPTQLIESGGALIAALIAGVLMWRGAPDGVAFLAAAAWFSAVRWYDFGLRVFPPTFRAPGWFYPAVYAVIILVCGVLAARRLGL
jgi:phosphatidylglycerol---prolipoprotein diacylglyceryl transferase